jgi:hypothetical protein
MQVDNSLDVEKDQEKQPEVNMSIPTTPVVKSRFALMDQSTIPFKKRTAFRQMFE